MKIKTVLQDGFKRLVSRYKELHGTACQNVTSLEFTSVWLSTGIDLPQITTSFEQNVAQTSMAQLECNEFHIQQETQCNRILFHDLFRFGIQLGGLNSLSTGK